MKALYLIDGFRYAVMDTKDATKLSFDEGHLVERIDVRDQRHAEALGTCRRYEKVHFNDRYGRLGR